MAIDRKIQPDGTEPPEEPEGHRIGRGDGDYPDIVTVKVLHQRDLDSGDPSAGSEPPER